MCYGHSTPVTATHSLRLIGGRSPGSQDSRRPRHPRALDDEELFIVEGSKNSTRANFGQLGKSADTGGSQEKLSEFPYEAVQQSKHLLCILLQFTRGEQDVESISGSEYRLHVENV